MELWICAVCAVLVVGCGGEQAKPAAPAPRVAIDGRYRLPDRVLAVLDVDIPRLRASPLWHLAGRILERESEFAAACPDVVEAAQSVTVALRVAARSDDNPAPDATFAIVRGIDAARARACLTGSAANTSARSPGGGTAEAAPDRPRECQRYDDEVHELAACKELPASLAPELRAAEAALAAAPRADAAKVCGQALSAVERANRRRSALGVDCLVGRDRARTIAKAASIGEPPGAPARRLDDRTFALGYQELVYLADDRTALSIRISSRDAARSELLPGELRALLAGPAQPRWYDADRELRRADQTVWLAVDTEQLAHHEDDEAPQRQRRPQRLVGSISLHGDVSIALRFRGARHGRDLRSTGELAELLLDHPKAQAVALRASCAGPAPTGPRADRCRRVFEHATAVMAAANSSSTSEAAADARHRGRGAAIVAAATEGFERESALDACVKTMPDSHLTCVERASTPAALERCWDKTAHAPDDALCGERDIAVDIEVPLLLVESLKLAELSDQHALGDCRGPGTGAPAALGIEVERDHPDAPTANVCLGGRGGCWSVDIADHPVAVADARWRPGRDLSRSSCRGPINLGTREYLTLDIASYSCPRIDGFPWMRASQDHQKWNVKLCGVKRHVKDCVTLRPNGELSLLSTDADDRFAALVTGPPGRQDIETWDLASARRLARFPAGTTPARPCAGAQLLDDAVLVTTGACDSKPDFAHMDDEAYAARGPVVLGAVLGSADGAYLATLGGKRIAAVGDPATAMIVKAPIRIGEHRWAFATATGDAVVIQNVATGKIEQRIATGAPVEPGMVAVNGDSSGHLVLVYGGATPRAHTLVSLDVASRAVTEFRAPPECPASKPTDDPSTDEEP
jgi:hypothetical protein